MYFVSLNATADAEPKYSSTATQIISKLLIHFLCFFFSLSLFSSSLIHCFRFFSIRSHSEYMRRPDKFIKALSRPVWTVTHLFTFIFSFWSYRTATISDAALFSLVCSSSFSFRSLQNDTDPVFVYRNCRRRLFLFLFSTMKNKFSRFFGSNLEFNVRRQTRKMIVYFFLRFVDEKQIRRITELKLERQNVHQMHTRTQTQWANKCEQQKSERSKHFVIWRFPHSQENKFFGRPFCAQFSFIHRWFVPTQFQQRPFFSLFVVVDTWFLVSFNFVKNDLFFRVSEN